MCVEGKGWYTICIGVCIWKGTLTSAEAAAATAARVLGRMCEGLSRG